MGSIMKYVLLYGHSEAEIKEFLTNAKTNLLYMTKQNIPEPGNPKYQEYQDIERLLVDPKGKNSAYIKLYGPSLAFISGSMQFEHYNSYTEVCAAAKAYEKEHQLPTQFKKSVKDSAGNECFPGNVVNVYFAEDGVTQQRINKFTQAGIYFDDHRHIPMKDSKRMLRVS